MAAHLIGDWNLARLVIEMWGKQFPRALKNAVYEEAEYCRAKVVDGITSGAPGGQRFRPLSPLTIGFRRAQAIGGIMAKRNQRVGSLLSGAQSKLSRNAGAGMARAIQAGSNKLMAKARQAADRAAARSRRKLSGRIQRIEAGARTSMTKALSKVSTKPLIQTADLLNSIRVVPPRPSEQAFIGVLRTARGRDGRSLFNIAKIHEYGAGPKAVKMTEKQRRYLMAMLSKVGIRGQGARGGGGVLIIRIPPRPFLGPVFAAEYGSQSKVSERFLARLTAHLPVGGTTR